jgi:nucleotide-binding universal stress UspA family protein
MAQQPFRHILVLVDGTEASLKAAECAVQLARAYKAQFAAVSVVDTAMLTHLLTSRIMVAAEKEEYERELESSSRRHLAYVADLARENGVKTQTVLLKGAVHSAVLAEQKSCGADLIVIGAFRWSLCHRDVTARERQLILDEAPCPVLVVR